MSDASQLPDDAARDRAQFRRNLTRVLAVQVITLAILWVMQRTFTP
jgi:hypothetical protein